MFHMPKVACSTPATPLSPGIAASVKKTASINDCQSPVVGNRPKSRNLILLVLLHTSRHDISSMRTGCTTHPLRLICSKHPYMSLLVPSWSTARKLWQTHRSTKHAVVHSEFFCTRFPTRFPTETHPSYSCNMVECSMPQQTIDDIAVVSTLPSTRRFFGCYLLASLDPKAKGRSYIGFTVNPYRRIRQHNGLLKNGAWRTKKFRPWDMVLVVYGFPTQVLALQFEWAWQHPEKSLAVREVAAKLGRKKLTGVQGKVRLLREMLLLQPWCYYPLTLQILDSKYSLLHAGCPALPEHINMLVAPMEMLPEAIDEDDDECAAAEEAVEAGSDSGGMGRLQPEQAHAAASSSAGSSDEDGVLEDAAAAQSDLEAEATQRRGKVVAPPCTICGEAASCWWSTCTCGTRAHLRCLAAAFKQADPGNLQLPSGGACPSCGAQRRWLDVLGSLCHNDAPGQSRKPRRRRGSREVRGAAAAAAKPGAAGRGDVEAPSAAQPKRLGKGKAIATASGAAVCRGTRACKDVQPDDVERGAHRKAVKGATAVATVAAARNADTCITDMTAQHAAADGKPLRPRKPRTPKPSPRQAPSALDKASLATNGAAVHAAQSAECSSAGNRSMLSVPAAEAWQGEQGCGAQEGTDNRTPPLAVRLARRARDGARAAHIPSDDLTAEETCGNSNAMAQKASLAAAAHATQRMQGPCTGAPASVAAPIGDLPESCAEVAARNGSPCSGGMRSHTDQHRTLVHEPFCGAALADIIVLDSSEDDTGHCQNAANPSTSELIAPQLHPAASAVPSATDAPQLVHTAVAADTEARVGDGLVLLPTSAQLQWPMQSHAVGGRKRCRQHRASSCGTSITQDNLQQPEKANMPTSGAAVPATCGLLGSQHAAPAPVGSARAFCPAESQQSAAVGADQQPCSTYTAHQQEGVLEGPTAAVMEVPIVSPLAPLRNAVQAINLVSPSPLPLRKRLQRMRGLEDGLPSPLSRLATAAVDAIVLSD